jgi:4'-phosphopantetheinyl transferase
VWWAPVSADATRAGGIARVLSVGERADMMRRARPADRALFGTSRALRRSLLGAYLGLDPRALRFEEDGDQPGKPRIVFPAPASSGDLRFNVSHAGERVVFAFACGREVGVDVERLDASLDLDEVARHMFSRPEQDALFAYAGELRVRAFYTCWTRKEALVKAMGQGLRAPLPEFDVALAPGGLPQLLASRTLLLDPGRWALVPTGLEPLEASGALEGYVSALAIEAGAGRHRPLVRVFRAD